MFRRAAQVWSENRDCLSEVDSRFGDGDHGVTVGKITDLIEKSLDGWDDDNVKTFLEDLGDNAMEIGGGSAGPLYGTMIRELPGPLEGDKPIDAGTLKGIFTKCLSTMKDVTNTSVGDKIMMDTLIPVVEAAQKAKDDVMAVLEAAKEAAARGAKESEQYVSKYGRTRNYKEKTIGTPDTGAASTSLPFAGLCDGLK